MKKLFILLETLFRLGLRNVAYVAWYRFSLRSGIRKYKFPVKSLATGKDLFLPRPSREGFPEEWKGPLVKSADEIVSGNLQYYAFHTKNAGQPPDWFLNPFSGSRYPAADRHWTLLTDFHPEAGDIKNIWEASRFEWVVTLARAYAISGNAVYLETINEWVRDWSGKNPLNRGPNWKCGQEASIRIFNLVNSSHILCQQNKPSKGLMDLVYAHLERISGNIGYAIAQDNNHGVSEAAGLFIGGSWLETAAPGSYPRARKYAKKGRRWLENRVSKLIGEDGSFSQHSVNYHRMMLDTLAFSEFWRRKTGGKPFSALFYSRTSAAIDWLGNITDPQSGNAPNLGGNDGAMLNNMHSAPYRDFRPSLNLAAIIFRDTAYPDDGPGRETTWWLGLEPELIHEKYPFNGSIVMKGGYTVMKSKGSWVLLRFPYFRFRPSHQDVFHLDLWASGQNIICDAGSFSYNPPKENAGLNLKSVKHHNTVSFDDHEQMPVIGRFLMGGWIEADAVGEILVEPGFGLSWTGSYTDRFKNRHKRTLQFQDNCWIIEDELSGPFKKAVIGFNINDAQCLLTGHRLKTSFGEIILPPGGRPALRESVVSEYYFENHPITRLNIEVVKPGAYVTKINLVA